MRINKFIAQNSKLSRRQADTAIETGRVLIDFKMAKVGDNIDENADLKITLDGESLNTTKKDSLTILINKPVGYVCSRDGQGSPSIYELIERKNHDLNIAGRLDKDSSGLVLMTNDGDLLYELTHPGNKKDKVYDVTINKSLNIEEMKKLTTGIDIGDERPSKFKNIKRLDNNSYEVVLTEGRNRQIRRTFEALGIRVKKLHRTKIGNYDIKSATY